MILEIVMEYRNASATIRGDQKLKGKMETKTLFIIKWRVHIWSVSRVETYKVLDVP